MLGEAMIQGKFHGGSSRRTAAKDVAPAARAAALRRRTLHPRREPPHGGEGRCTCGASRRTAAKDVAPAA